TDSSEAHFTVAGTPLRVAAIDGTDENGPTPIEGKTLVVPAGGRLDVAFEMPARPVRISLAGTNAALALSADGRAVPPEPPEGPEFDRLAYGKRKPTPFALTTRYDRRFDLTITRKPGFFDGKPGRQWAINGGIYPDVPMFMVAEGDLVEMTIANDSHVVHPMH